MGSGDTNKAAAIIGPLPLLLWSEDADALGVTLQRLGAGSGHGLLEVIIVLVHDIDCSG